MTDFDVERSWAVEPLFYDAPYPGMYQPRQYQLAGVEYALAREHALLGDAPGLGKSAEAVLIGNAIEAKRSLVINPASLSLNWAREVNTWSTLVNVQTYPVLKARDGVSPDAQYVIMSYAMLRNPAIFHAVMSMRWDHLILDEAHALKDPKGNQRTNLICAPDGLQSVCGRITMASGSILPNQPIECYNAVRLLDWDAIDRMSVDDFRDHYYGLGGGMIRGPYLTKDKRGDPVWKTGPHWSERVRNQPRHLDELRYRLRSRVMVRRLKEHVLRELPPKHWHLFPLATTPGLRKVMKHPGWDRATQMYEMDPDAFSAQLAIDGEISTAWRLMGEEKAPAVADYVEQLLLEGAPGVVVGAWHRSVLAILRERLDKHGLTYMDGGVSTKKKQLAVDEFQRRDDIRVILGQVMPLGEGWNLHKAQDVVVAQPHPTPGRNDQLLDRAHRLGQEGDYVIGHVPIVPDSLDERWVGRAIVKDQSIHRALDGDGP